MLLCDCLVEKGNTLFRYRGYVYFLALPMLYLERGHIHHFGHGHACYELFCVLVSVLGMLVRALTMGFVPRGTSGRNKRAQHAEALNTTGMYSICRNPLYLGNYLVFLGITLLGQSWELVVMNTFLFAAMHVPIILTEERYLLGEFGERYRDYASVTPCFFPRPSLWKSPALPWNWWLVVRREHDTALSVALAYVFVGCLRDSVMRGRVSMDLRWAIVGLASVLLWLAVKVAKRPLRRLSERVAA